MFISSQDGFPCVPTSITPCRSLALLFSVLDLLLLFLPQLKPKLYGGDTQIHLSYSLLYCITTGVQNNALHNNLMAGLTNL
jgi:hypothetical protein